MPAVQEIFVDATLCNTWTNRTPQKIMRTGVAGSIPIYTTIHSEIIKTYTPASSDRTGTRIFIGTSGTSTEPPAEGIWIPGVGNKRQSPNPDHRDYNKLDISNDGKLTNKFVAPPILTDVVSDNISDSPILDINVCVGMHLAADSVNSVILEFVDLGFSNVSSLDKGAVL